MAGCSAPFGNADQTAVGEQATPIATTAAPTSSTTTLTGTTTAHPAAPAPKPTAQPTAQPTARPAPTTPRTAPPAVVPVSPLTVAPTPVQPVAAQPLPSSPSQIAAAVLPAVVDVDTTLSGGRAAGTGMVLLASGVVLTNNHVVDGATSITATAVTTGRTYRATVVGVDPTADVALLQLQGVAGLPTIAAGTAVGAAPGDGVVAIGNAQGAGGMPSVTGGTIEATGQSIVATDSFAGISENLHDMLETDAATVPGDSGGPLVDVSGAVVGMVTAGGTANTPTGTIAVSFAIPIDNALAVAQDIENGQSSPNVLLGLPGYLGVEVAAPGPGGPAGALVTSVVPVSVARSAGLVDGDTITSLGGLTVASPADLKRATTTIRAGTSTTLGWVDQAGSAHSAIVILDGGPAD